MKTALLFCAIILLSFPAFSLQNPFAKKKECPEPEQPKKCFHRIKISPSKEYVFIAGCEVIRQIGVVFNKTRTIVFLNESQKPTGWKKATGPNGFAADKEKNFKGMIDIEFKNFNENDFN